MSSSRSAAGRLAHANGEIAEGIVAKARELACAAKLADVRKVPVPMRYDPSKKAWVHAERSTVDGVGYVMAASAAGTFIADEVKSVSGEAPVRISRVEEHQREFLDSVHANGGIAVVTFVLLGERLRMIAMYPWYEIRDRVSIPVAELRSNAVAVNRYGDSLLLCG